MRVYDLRADVERYQSLELQRTKDWDKVHSWFDGKPIGRNWVQLAVRVLREDKSDDKLLPSDFPNLGGGMCVFSERAVEALTELLGGNGEFLPLRCNEGTYFAFNVTCVVDALDTQESECKFFSNGRIMHVKRYEFHPDRLKGLVIFKLPQLLGMSGLVTDKFVQQVQDAGLVGFDFRPVWPCQGK